MSDWRPAFCRVCPHDPPSSLCLPPSPSQGSPAGFTFTKYHYSSPRRGARAGCGGVGRGPVTGQCVPLVPSLFSLRIQASAKDSSHTPTLQPLQCSSKFIQGRTDLLPSIAPLLHHPCLFPLPILLFFVSDALFPLLDSLIPSPSHSVFLLPLTLLLPLEHHSSYFVPPVLDPVSGLSW